MNIFKLNLANLKRHGFNRHGLKRHGFKHRDRHGLSVIEVLTSIVVALVGLAGVLAMIPFSVKQTQSGLDQDAATTMARNALSNFEASGYKIVSGTPERLNWLTDDGSGVPPIPMTTGINDPNFGSLVCIDPLGITEQNDVFNTFPFNSLSPFTIPTVTLARPDGKPFEIADARRMFRLTDDLVFAESDAPITASNPEPELNGPQQVFNESVDTALPINRQSTGAVSWCAIAQPIINDPNAEEVDAYKFHVLVFKDRVTDSLVQESEMAAAAVVSPVGVVAQPLSNITIGVPLTEDIRRNDWVMLAPVPPVPVPSPGQVAFDTNIAFARVSNFSEDTVAGTTTLTLDGPDYDFTNPTVVVHLRDVVAVFPRTIKLETISADWTVN